MNGANQTWMDEYSYHHDTYVPNEPQYDSSDIVWCIFLITSVCGGLPALVWAFHLLHLHRKIRRRISVFILLLLLSDLIQLPLNIYIVTAILTKYRYYNPEIYQFWSGLRWCGLHLHQLVALEGVLILKYPLRSARIFSLPFYIIISSLVLLFSILSALFLPLDLRESENMLLFSLSTSVFPLILLAVTFTITCKACSTPVRKSTCSVFTLAVLTFILYLPFMLMFCVDWLHILPYINRYLLTMFFCLVNLRVISEPVLCVVVCRGDLRDVQTQTHTEHNADETSV